MPYFCPANPAFPEVIALLLESFTKIGKLVGSAAGSDREEELPNTHSFSYNISGKVLGDLEQ